MDQFDLAIHAAIEDRFEHALYQRRIDEVIADGRLTVCFHVPGNMVPPVCVSSADPNIVRHALKRYVALRNQEAKLQAMPLSERRKYERAELARLEREAREAPPCPGCGGTGYVPDDDGNEQDCPLCQGSSSPG